MFSLPVMLSCSEDGRAQEHPELRAHTLLSKVNPPAESDRVSHTFKTGSLVN